jgi:NhaP-type Na+/H+ or K+/H+ antiporter
MLVYGIAEHFGGNGAIGVFVFGLVLGNMHQINRILDGSLLSLESRAGRVQTPPQLADKKFHAQIAFLLRKYFFAMLGVMFYLPDTGLIFLSIGIVGLLLLVRFLMINMVGFGMKIPRQDKVFMTMLCARGLAAAVLASLTYSLPIADIIRNVTTQVVLFTSIISSLIAVAVKTDRGGRI